MDAWAKAPDFADRPQRRAEVHARTAADRQRYLEAGLTPVGCRTCGIEVLVRKSSAQQKSVQWTVRPADHCPVFQELGGGPGRPGSCPHLERAIDYAVEEGLLPVQG